MLTVSGQSINVGVKGGPSWSKINAESILNEEARLAYHIGLFGNKYLSKNFSLHSEINYLALGAKHERQQQNTNRLVKWEYDLNYINLPLGINYHLHQTIALGAGFYTGFLVGFNVRRESDFSNTIETPDRDNLKSQDYGYYIHLSLNYANASLGVKYRKALTTLPDSNIADRLISESQNSAILFSLNYILFQKN